MTEFIPIITTSDKLDTVLVNNGQLIFVIDTKKIYIDLDNNTRTEMAGLAGSDFLAKNNPTGTGSLSLNGMTESDSGEASVELGQNTNARGVASTALGIGTVATADGSFVCGRYNLIDDNNKYIYIVGGGSGIGDEKNLFTIDFEGNVKVAGKIIDGYGNTFSDVLNFETLTRMITSGENTGISITVGQTEEGDSCFNSAVSSLPEISIDADGYWLMNGERVKNANGQYVQARGLSAYEIAVINGFTGTEIDWLASLKGDPGVTEVQITTEKKDIHCTLLGSGWSKTPPYRQVVYANGIKESMNPRVDIVISDDIVLGRAELNSYCKITRILTFDGGITAECYQDPPDSSIDLNLLIEVV